ncbi:AMP-binding protein [Thermus antranikianii]|uniref:AMP-binding protein n=1 Tax=Thermus antranikianii TaxID=88190 RepID=A0ABY7RR03_9DEIN|nr:AMP-binding protein [Thermus antranikianii]WCM39914.1 AMP-binding protein [Thermus antranikianii]
MRRLRLKKLDRKDLLATFRWPSPRWFNLATDTVDRWAKVKPGDLALLEPGGRKATYAQLSLLSMKWAVVLRAYGVSPGDRVAILFPQGLEAALAHLATYRIGAIALPLSVLFGSEAVRYRLEHGEARVLLADREALEPLEGAIPDGVKIIPKEALWTLAEKAIPDPKPHPTQPSDPAILIYTSGTTGKPKGALLPHGTLIGHFPGFYLYSNFPRRPATYWSPADWAWMGGLMDVLFPALYYGFTVIAYRAKRFDPEEALWLMEHFGVTHTFLFPTALKMLRSLGAIRGKRLRLRSIHSGGEPLGEELQAWAQENLGLPVNEFYGQTEANLLVGNSFSIYPIRPGSMGLPYPGHEVVVLREDGSLAEPGELGEIALKTPDPVAFLGYWKNPEATQAKFLGPYLLTGDLATVDDEGYLWFKGRKDDLIKSAGYRISPFEVEEVLLTHPGVAMVGVVGLPDPERGEKVVAFVKLRPGYLPSPGLTEELKTLVRSKVGHHAYPREVRFVEELPLTPTGKIQRFRLRTLAQEAKKNGEVSG